ncbi:hypothetical protein C0Q70_02554 [Pomacea canaliculata]|uniref:Uncharacterized protein n=1 Tax=Pomacea canaliculata TaxID=400727 RepID=A0A2T7PQ88_POMCA|nr:hypothetical protein C0Q70_02554 [Pomacea canaliculata]
MENESHHRLPDTLRLNAGYHDIPGLWGLPVYRPDTKLESELMRRNVTEGLQILSSIRDLHWAKLGEDPSFNNDLTSMIEDRLRDHVKKNNLTAWFNSTQREGGMCEIVYIGICAPNEILLDWNFLSVYQKCYTALFFVCLVIVGVLYAMIYRFIGLRRNKKLQQKLILCSYVNGDNVCGEGGTRTTFLNGNGHDDCLNNGLGAGGVYIGGCVTSSVPVKAIKNTLVPPTVGKIFKEPVDFIRLDTAQPRSDDLTQSDTTAKKFSKPSTSGEANGLPLLRNDVIHIMTSSSSKNGGGPVSNGEVAIEMKTLKEQYSPVLDQDSPGHRYKFTPEERRRSVGVGELDKRCPTPPRRRRRNSFAPADEERERRQRQKRTG